MLKTMTEKSEKPNREYRIYELFKEDLRGMEEAINEIESILQVLGEQYIKLNTELESAATEEEREKIQAKLTRIQKEVEADEISLENLRVEMAQWRVELRDSAARILKDFTPDKEKPQ